MKRNKSFLVSVLKFLLYASVFAPLIINVSSLFPFVFPKAIFFEALIEAALLIFLALLTIDKSLLPKKNALTLALGAWFLALLLATVFSFDPSFSFWSKAERMDGLFWHLHLLAFFLMAVPVFEKEFVKFLSINSLAGLLTGVYSLASKYLPQVVSFGDQTRLGGTFGNPAFLGTYFLVMFFLNWILFILYSGAEKKFFAALGTLSFVLVVLSGTRGAWIGMALGLALFAVLVMFFRAKKYWRFGFGILAVLFLLLVSFKSLPQVWEKISPFFASRIYALWDIPKPRLIVWQIGWNAFLERPVFGWGPENFIYAYNKHFIPDLHTYEMATFDRPHNKILDLLVMSGALGLLAYLGLYAVLGLKSFLSLIFHRYDDKEFLIRSLFLSLVAAYFVQNLVLFEMPSSGIAFFVVLLLGAWLFFGDKESQPVFDKTLPRPALYFLAGFLFLAFFRGLVLPSFAANGVASSAFSLTPSGNPSMALKQAQNEYLKARNLNTFLNREVDSSIARRLDDYGTVEVFMTQLPEYQDFSKAILENIKKDIVKHPNDYDLAVVAGSIAFKLETAAATSPEKSEAVAFFEKAIAMAPKREDAYQYLFLWSLKNSQKEKAKNYTDNLIGLNPRMGLFWFYQAEYEARWGEIGLMREYLEKAKEFNYDVEKRSGDWELLVTSLILGGRKQEAILELEKIIKIPGLPVNFLVRDTVFLIQKYVETGQINKAKIAKDNLFKQLTPQQIEIVTNHLKQNSLWFE
ncbi:MAG: O-antigen ligase [Parcubacteria group bacterium GW2011_GWC1_45_9]|nr:MAG: O-antigen ligase [Parcubacteria group bacterium GW2011_GWB1_45_10]KKU17009.1 MAG: O-antigen ligase [Parcubacteria group bacterium GW2011_GWC1_45_9]